MDINELDSDFGGNSLTITPQIREFLRETAKWGKLLSIVGMIGVALMVIAGIFMGTIMGSIAGMDAGIDAGMGPAAGLMGGAAMTLMYIVIAAIYIMPILYLYRFSTKLKTALESDNQEYLSGAFQNLKSMFKFMGIFTVVVLAFYGLGLVMALVGGAFLM